MTRLEELRQRLAILRRNRESLDEVEGWEAEDARRHITVEMATTAADELLQEGMNGDEDDLALLTVMFIEAWAKKLMLQTQAVC